MPMPHGAQDLPLVSSVDFLNADDGWLVLQAPHGMGSSPGVLFRTSDGGATWHAVSRTPIMNVAREAPPTLPVAGQVEFRSPEDGWLVGGQVATGPHALYATKNGGATWHLMALPTYPPGALSDSVAGMPRTRGELLTVSVAYQDSELRTGIVLFRSSDGGRTWRVGASLFGGDDVALLSPETALALRLSPFDPLHPNRNVAASVWRTNDGGASWHLVSDLSRALRRQLAAPLVSLSLTFVDSRTGFVWATTEVAGSPQRTFWIDETTDGGRTWASRWPANAN